MSIIPQLSVLILLLLIAIVFLLALRNSDKGRSSIIDPGSAGKNLRSFFGGSGGQANPHSRGKWKTQGGTKAFPKLFIDQLDPRTMEPVARFTVPTFPPNGVTISRPNADSGTFLLKDLHDPDEVAFTVSKNHVRIGMDSAGIYLQDNDSLNKTYRDLGGDPVDELNITDGMIVYLGSQPIMFRIPNLKSRAFDAPEAKTETGGAGKAHGGPKSSLDAPMRRRH